MGLLASAGFGLALGFSLAVPPGPMNALIASSAARSYRAGLLTALGAMSSDAVLGAVVLSLSTWIDLHAVVRPLDAVGAGVLAYFGLRLIWQPRAPAPSPAGIARTYSQGLALGLSNPFQILWWLTAGLAFARLGGAVLFVGLFGAIAVWVVGFPYAVHAGVRRYPRIDRGILVLSAAILFAFAGYFAALAI